MPFSVSTLLSLLTSVIASTAAVAPDSDPALATAAGRSDQEATEHPRLIVVLAVDQLIPEQLERLASRFTGGLAKLSADGLQFRRAHLDYARTETGPGHATLITGCLPRTHGIVGNAFWDRQLGKERYCVEDDDAVSVTDIGLRERDGHRSPANLLVPGLGDHLKARSSEARVVSIAAKDRSAVCMGGKGADLALWWDTTEGGFQSSTAYGQALPEWVVQWNQGWIDAASAWTWTPLADEGLELLGTAPDQRAGESPFLPTRVRFPYQLPELAPDAPRGERTQLASLTFQTPLLDDFVAKVGAGALESLALGADDSTDLLALGFSVCDIVGHADGPYSREVTDVVLRLDVLLGELFALLDERVGEGRWMACLSADHGVLPLPEGLAAEGIDARRVGNGEVRAVWVAARDALNEEFKSDFGVSLNGSGLVLDAAALAESGQDAAAVHEVTSRAALEGLGMGTWVAATYTMEQLSGTEAGEPFLRLYRNSFHPERSADVVLRQKPWTLLGRALGTSHGSPYPYDRAVPLVFYGPGFARGQRFDHVGTHDAVPTILGRLGLATDNPLDGRDLLGPR